MECFQLDFYIIDSMNEDKDKEKDKKRGRMSTDSTTSKTAFEGSRGTSLNDVCGGRLAKCGSQGRRKEEQVREIKSTIEEIKPCGSNIWMLCVDTGHGDPSSRSVSGPRRSSERWEVHEMEGYRDSE